MKHHYEQHCDEFNQFVDNTLEWSAIDDMLCSICEFGNGKDVIVTRYQSLDREGGNHEICGYVTQGQREYAFRVCNGNWNGTEVVEWEEIFDGITFSLTDRSVYYEN